MLRELENHIAICERASCPNASRGCTVCVHRVCMEASCRQLTGTKSRVDAHAATCQFASRETVELEKFNALVSVVEQRDEVRFS
jgi:hypothetical protein